MDTDIVLQPTDRPATAAGLLADPDPHAYWVLSNGRAWTVVLGQNIRDVPPAVWVAPTGVLFVGLYHGCIAALAPDDGAVLHRLTLWPGNMVFWSQHGDFVVAAGELEIAVFEPGGTFLWRAAMGDVIETIDLRDGVFELGDAAGHRGRYDARTGRAAT